jgi:hypothetical protein
VRFGIRREIAIPLDSFTTASRVPISFAAVHVHGGGLTDWNKENNRKVSVMASDYLFG